MFTSLLKLVFQSIMSFIFLLIVVLQYGCSQGVANISSYQSFINLLKSLSKSFVISLILILPLFEIAFLMRFSCVTLLHLSKRCLNPTLQQEIPILISLFL